MFTTSATSSNATVKKAADDYRKNQVKSQLFKTWSDNTEGSKNSLRNWIVDSSICYRGDAIRIIGGRKLK